MNKNLLVKIAMIAALLAGGFFLYHNFFPYFRGGYGGYHMGGGMAGHWGMGFMMPLFWVLIIAAVVSLVGRATVPGHSGSDWPDAIEVLRKRYAKGEIDKAEFMAKRADLQER